MKNFHIRNIPADQFKALRILAATNEISINEMILRLIEKATKIKRGKKS